MGRGFLLWHPTITNKLLILQHFFGHNRPGPIEATPTLRNPQNSKAVCFVHFSGFEMAPRCPDRDEAGSAGKIAAELAWHHRPAGAQRSGVAYPELEPRYQRAHRQADAEPTWAPSHNFNVRSTGGDRQGQGGGKSKGRK